MGMDAGTAPGVSSLQLQQKKMKEEIIVTKSASDHRLYRAYVLDNKLKVMLISDSKAEKAAASITVGGGSMSDPEELPGLFHFAEHMCFLGTEKYPVENEFDKFLSDHGGGSNAFTEHDHTNYHFDISPDKLVASLDRFAQFFISPLFNENSTEREIQAVASEHDKNITDDDWRSNAIQQCTSNPRHSYSKFGTGNLETLWTNPKANGIDIIAALKEYHAKFYSSNIMALAVLGRESLDELENMATPLFSLVKNSDAEMEVWPESPFDADHLGIKIYVVPVKDLRQMSVVFPFPDTTDRYKAGSTHYLTHLLGHESSGSLLSLLKKKGWVNELSADIATEARGFGMASIEMELSKSGLQHVDEIAEILFQYLEMVRQSGPQQWVWEELRDVEAMNFRFLDQKCPEDTVCDLTPKMLSYPLEDVLSADYLITEYNPEEIVMLMTNLVPEKCRITVFAKENESKADQVEQYYGIQYAVEKIDAELIQKWKTCGLNAELHLPLKNEFIPSVFELKPRDNTGIIPRKISNGPLSRAFFLQDNEFLLPKAVVRVEISSPLPKMSPLNQTLVGLLKRLVEDSLTEVTYNASVSGLKYHLLESVYGLEIYVAGYDHKLGVLLQKVVERLVTYCCDPERFVVMKEAYSRALSNWRKEQPSKHANWYLGYLLREKRWTHEEMLEALKGVTLEDLTKFLKEFLQKVRLEWLLYGNLTEEEAKDLVRKCEKLFEDNGTQALTKEEDARMRELKLKPGSDFLYTGEHHTHSDSCVTVLFQGGEEETRGNVLMELMDQFAYEGCYNQLRTVEQLGYYVWTTIRKANRTRGFQILVQSGFDPAYVEKRIDCYLECLHKTLDNMTEEEFLQHRLALAVRKAEKPKEIGARGEHLWAEIETRLYNFDRVEVELKELETVTLQDAIEFFEGLIGPSSLKRKRLNVHVQSKAKKKKGKNNKSPKCPLDESPSKVIERNPTKIENVCEWKACQEMFPSVSCGSVE